MAEARARRPARLGERARAFALDWADVNGTAAAAQARGDRPERSRMAAAFDAVDSLDRLAAETYRLRARALDGGARLELEEAENVLSDAAQELGYFARDRKQDESGSRVFLREYRTAWREHVSLFVFTLCWFAACCLLGWNVGANEPDYLPLIASQDAMERIQNHDAWFEKLRANPLMGAAGIAINNMKVSGLMFLAGSLFGFGGLALLAYNGLFFGAIFGYCWTYGFHKALGSFVLTHGPLELSLIVASCFAGLLVGRCFYRRPFKTMPERLRRSGREAAILAMGILPWLTLAAAFEGFVSPFDVPAEKKAMLGALIALLFWAWTFGKVPPKPKAKPV